MTVLIVEDDRNKAAKIAGHVRATLPAAEVIERRSYQSGLKQALTSPPDLILLDMTLPTYDVSAAESGGRTRPYGGREILGELLRNKITVPVVVVTQFENFGEGANVMTLAQLTEQLAMAYPEMYKGTVYYHPAMANWTEELQRLLIKLRVDKGSNL